MADCFDYDTFDERIKTAFEDAEKAGLSFEFIPETANTEHPNTARIVIGDGKQEMSMVGYFNRWWKNRNYRVKRISIATFR